MSTGVSNGTSSQLGGGGTVASVLYPNGASSLTPNIITGGGTGQLVITDKDGVTGMGVIGSNNGYTAANSIPATYTAVLGRIIAYNLTINNGINNTIINNDGTASFAGNTFIINSGGAFSTDATRISSDGNGNLTTKTLIVGVNQTFLNSNGVCNFAISGTTPLTIDANGQLLSTNWSISSGGTFNGGNINSAGGVNLTATGGRLNLRKSVNGALGTFAVNGATAVNVANTSVTANSMIFFTMQLAAGTPSFVKLNSITAGTGFQIQGVALDTSSYAYIIIEATA